MNRTTEHKSGDDNGVFRCLRVFHQVPALDPVGSSQKNDGVVAHPNLVKFSGHVGRSGAVRASVTVHDKYASGSGKLTRDSGGSGHAAGGRCSGYWTAQRKQLGRDHPEASRASPAERAVRGWAGDGPASCQAVLVRPVGHISWLPSPRRTFCVRRCPGLSHGRRTSQGM